MKPLDRLRQECKAFKNYENKFIDSIVREDYLEIKNYYNAMRLFCLDCELVSFNEIELMENEINSTIIQDSIDSWSK